MHKRILEMIKKSGLEGSEMIILSREEFIERFSDLKSYINEETFRNSIFCSNKSESIGYIFTDIFDREENDLNKVRAPSYQNSGSFIILRYEPANWSNHFCIIGHYDYNNIGKDDLDVIEDHVHYTKVFYGSIEQIIKQTFDYIQSCKKELQYDIISERWVWVKQ